MKIKHDLLSWLLLFLLYPVFAFLFVFFINTLGVIFGEDQTYDLYVLFIFTVQIFIFVLLFFILMILYTSYMVFDEYDIKIYVKSTLNRTINYENIKSIKYIKFRLSSLLTFIWDETNMIVIDYIDEDGSTKRFTAKIFKYEYNKIKKKLNEDRRTRENL